MINICEIICYIFCIFMQIKLFKHEILFVLAIFFHFHYKSNFSGIYFSQFNMFYFNNWELFFFLGTCHFCSLKTVDLTDILGK